MLIKKRCVECRCCFDRAGRISVCVSGASVDERIATGWRDDVGERTWRGRARSRRSLMTDGAKSALAVAARSRSTSVDTSSTMFVSKHASTWLCGRDAAPPPAASVSVSATCGTSSLINSTHLEVCTHNLQAPDQGSFSDEDDGGCRLLVGGLSGCVLDQARPGEIRAGQGSRPASPALKSTSIGFSPYVPDITRGPLGYTSASEILIAVTAWSCQRSKVANSVIHVEQRLQDVLPPDHDFGIVDWGELYPSASATLTAVTAWSCQRSKVASSVHASICASSCLLGVSCRRASTRRRAARASVS